MNKIYKHCIDEGHGGVDPGAIGSKGTHEAIFTLDIGKIVGRILTEQGQQVIHTRTTDIWLSLDERADIANRNLCNTFISIHCNSFKEPKAHGTETWSHPRSVEGMKLSKLVQEELVKATGLTDRGCKQANYGVLRMSNMVAILVETAFISNIEEEALLGKPEFKEKVAKAIVKGIFRYLGLEFKEEAKGTVPTGKDLKVNYVIEFQKFYNSVTKTGAPLQENGAYGPATEKAYQTLGKLIKGEY